MKYRLKLTAIAAVLGFFTLPSLAQGVNGTKGYIGAEYGSFAFKDQTTVATALVSAVGGSASSVQDAGMTVGRLFGGLTINENVGAELGYIITNTWAATFSGRSRGGVNYAGSASRKASGVDYSALLRPSVSSGWNGLFARVGGHSINTQTGVTLSAGTTSGVANLSESGSGLLMGLGYDIKMSDQAGVRLAYTVYNTISGVSGNDLSLFTVGLVARF